MISGIGQYIHGGFYQGKAEIFDSAITSYDSTGDQDSLDIITSLMVESGFRDSDNCFIDLDREFFTDGVIDRDKCDNFKKELILHYSLNQLKYSFFGTQSKMTRITEDALKREGKDLNDYLPVDERRKRAKAKSDKLNSKLDKQKRENKVPIYIYADGSLSTSVENEKCKTTFNKLGGNGGSFNFAKGYDPNNKVDNKGWIAGFNRDETWEVIENRNSSTNKTQSLTENHREVSTDVELLFDEDFLYLTDNENLLLEGVEEEFYSVTGELYAKREIDREKSINSIKDAIKKSGVKSIKGIVLKDDNKDTIKYYKDNFKEFITKETVFTSTSDNKLSKTITGIKDRQREEQLSLNILSQFQTLKAENRSADEIIQALESPEESKYSVELNIFSNPEDMTIFLNQESVKELDEDVRDYIQTLDVPMESSKELSRSFQNIINSKTISEDTNLNKRELLSKSYNRVVNKSEGSISETITKTVTLSSLINQQADTKIDLNNPEERTVWLKDNVESNYSAELSSKIESILTKDELTEAENANIINGFNHIGDIASSTGMTPIELVNYVLTEDKKEKKVHIEKDLNTILDNTISIVPNSAELTANSTRINTSFNLTNPVDIIHFANSPLVDSYEDDQTKEDLIKYLRSKPVSVKDSKEFSLDLVNALNNREKFPNGSNSLIIARTIADSINGNNKEVNKLVEKSLSIYKKEKPAEIKYNLMDNSDLNSFKFDPVLSALTPDESEDLLSYLNTKPVSNKNSEEFSSAILESLKKTSSFPEYTKARDIAESLALKVNGLTIPKDHEAFVNSVLSRKEQPTVPLKYDFSTEQGITSFSKDPILESFSSDEQSELISFLKTKPVPEAQSKEYTEALISGIKNNRNQNPVEYAKVLSKAMASMPVVSKADSKVNMQNSQQAVPMTYNFAERSSVDTFSNDPIVTAFSTDDQKELLSYLKSNPVPVQKSKEFSESLVRGLKNNKRQNPAEFAKALTKVLNGESTQDIPAEFKPLLTTSLNVSSADKNKAVPLNYNFSDSGDVNRLQYDPVMASFSDGDQVELINYLKSNPVSVKDSPQFSSRLTSGLRSLPKMTSPVSFASSLATSMNRSKANLTKPAKSYNLMSNSGLSSFYKTKMFRDSGINKASFTSVVNNHRSSISSYTPNSSVMFPVSFKTVNNPTPESTPIQATGQQTIGQPTPNNIYNQGYVVKKSSNAAKPVVRSINNSSKVKDVYKAFNQSASTPAQMPTISTPQVNTGMQSAMIDTRQFNPAPDNFGSNPAPTFTPQPQRQFKAPKPKLSPEEEKMQRIQQNYINDKQALQGQGQQMLAKSKTKDVGSAGSGSGGKSSGSGRSIKELSETLAEEIRNNLDSTMM